MKLFLATDLKNKGYIDNLYSFIDYFYSFSGLFKYISFIFAKGANQDVNLLSYVNKNQHD